MIIENLLTDNLDSKVVEYIDKLKGNRFLEDYEYLYILDNLDANSTKYLIAAAREVANNSYGKDVYMRGLIEFTNYCKQNCNYCGIRLDNDFVNRYRLSLDDILDCCREGYLLGLKTFVLQGGEDAYFTKQRLVEIISAIKSNYPDCAVTLSIGERPYDDYKAFYEAGADRFLLRHETATKDLYEYLHPNTMSYENRYKCLNNLKEIGFQVGIGFMVGSPNQTNQDLVNDLKFLELFQPAMCGIGPYIVHNQTPFSSCESGSVDATVVMVALARLILPNCLIPATTALGTLESDGRERALLAGANVLMPNLSPLAVKKQYEIYKNKAGSGEEAASSIDTLVSKVNNIGLNVNMEVGHTLMKNYKVGDDK